MDATENTEMLSIRPLPTKEHPHRARVAHQWGRWLFNDRADAEEFLDHPAGTAASARAYIAWLDDKDD